MVIQLAEGVKGLFNETEETPGLISDGWSSCYINSSNFGGLVRVAGATIPIESLIIGLQYYFRLDGGTAPSWDFWCEIVQSHGTYKVAEMTETDLNFNTGIRSIWFANPIRAKAGDIIYWCWDTPAGTIHIEHCWNVSITAKVE